jgi:hypothetical protein
MKVRTEHFEVRTGRTFRKVIRILNADGSVRDLSGWQARMSIKADVDDVAPLVTLTSSPAAGLTITPLAGEIEIKIDDSATALYTWESGVYDLVITNGTDAEPVLEGGIIVRKSVTSPS